MASTDIALSHEEIWDDSALVDSWDEALQEYKKYHSIQATGGDVTSILKEAEGEEAQITDAPPQVREEYQPSIEDGEVDQEAIEPTTGPRIVVPELENIMVEPQKSIEVDDMDREQGSVGAKASDRDSLNVPSQTPSLQGPLPPPMPQHLVGGGAENEAIRNLMMSWYFAGYYTGLYEGQQQQQQQQQQDPEDLDDHKDAVEPKTNKEGL